MMNLNYKNEYTFSTILLAKLQSLFRFYQIFLLISFAPGSNIRTHIAFLDVMSPWKWKCSLLSPVRLFATPWTVAHQAPLSMGFPRQEYWNGLPFPSTEDLPNPWIKPGSPILQAYSSLFEPPGKPHVSFSSLQSLSRVWHFATPWITARQASLSITNTRSSLRLTSIESVMPSSHLILCRPLLLLPPIPPSIRVFSSESTLRMRWPKY